MKAKEALKASNQLLVLLAEFRDVKRDVSLSNDITAAFDRNTQALADLEAPPGELSKELRELANLSASHRAKTGWSGADERAMKKAAARLDRLEAELKEKEAENGQLAEDILVNQKTLIDKEAEVEQCHQQLHDVGAEALELKKEIEQLKKALGRLKLWERADDIRAFEKEGNLNYDQRESIKRFSRLLRNEAMIVNQILNPDQSLKGISNEY